MISLSKNSSEKVFFTDNKEAELSMILNHLSYMKKDGMPYKYVNILRGSTYHPNGAPNTLSSIKIEAKGTHVYIVDNRVNFNVSSNTQTNLVNYLNSFGNAGFVIIKGVKFKLPFSKKGTTIADGNGVTIGFESKQQIPDKIIHNLINRLQTDNSRILAPLVQRYLNTIHQAGQHKNLITGYAHLPTYLTQLREPSIEIDDGGSDDTDYIMTFESRSGCSVTVKSATDQSITSEFQFAGSLTPSSGATTPDPYILLTTNPIKLLNQKMPNFVIKTRHMVVFASPLIFNSRLILKDLRGGVNLLK